MSSTCTYRHPLRNTDSADDESYWECHRSTTQDNDRCLFHYRTEQWTKGEVNPEQIQEAFRDAIIAGSREDLQFIGARFGPLDLRFNVLDSPTNHPIDLSGATFFGSVDLGKAIVNQPMILDGCQFVEGLDASGGTFERDLSAHAAHSNGDIVLDGATLNGGASFDGIEVEGRFGFVNADIRGPLTFGSPDSGEASTDTRTIVTDALDLSAAKLNSFTSLDIDSDTLDLSYADVDHSVIIQNASLGSFLARSATIGDLSLDSSTVEKDTELSMTTITGRTVINGRFGSSFEARDARFRGFTAVSPCVFGGVAKFDTATFEKKTVVRAQVRTGMSFEGTTFDDTLLLFISNPIGPMVVNLDRAKIPEGGISPVLEPEESRFSWRNLVETKTDERDKAVESVQERSTPFGEWPEDKFDVDLPVYFDLRHATLGDVEIIGCGEGSPLEHFRFLDTKFDGFDFTDYREEFRTANWLFHRFGHHPVDSEEDQGADDGSGSENGDGRPDAELTSDDDGTVPSASESQVIAEQEVTDGGQERTGRVENTDEVTTEELDRMSEKLDEIREGFEGWGTDMSRTTMELVLYAYNNEFDAETEESTYQRAKLGAKRAGDDVVAAEFFRRELTYRRRTHWKRLRTRRSLLGKLRAMWAYASNGLLALTCGYGERPSRVILTAIATIAAFAWIIFPSLGSSNTVTNPITGLVFSMEAFVSLILGDPVPDSGSELFTLAATTEAFVGAFLIALFVVTLTRSIHR